MDILESALETDHGLHGVLRYRRELIERKISLLPLETDDDQLVWCEFCGKQLKQPLYSDYTQDPEDFCCIRYKELFEKVVEESRFLQELSAGFSQSTLNPEEQQDFGSGHWLREKLRLQQMEMEKFIKEAAAKPSSDNSSLYTINFKLSSCAPLENSEAKEGICRKKEKSGSYQHHSTDIPGLAGFGLCHHQENASFIQKFYSTGNKFLTAFTDGSAQVFYPSGNLAIIILIDDTEAVCIVYDDVSSSCPIRALFSSEGRVTCYHNNGSIWLSMDKWGGQSLDDNGARTRKWSWTDHSHNPVTLRPIYLSLNKNVGVRVLGRESIFVCFLASGQQARFSVGSCSKTVNT
ncbi:glutamate-rich protein 6 isoform X2 [Trichomycterus rosablanca]|uniref:glutamate-rich protein 6 isoform X2 n=1 Tax=Trichomycterus rosablanca TaxID=2290929 RepID=UPI002F35FEBE